MLLIMLRGGWVGWEWVGVGGRIDYSGVGIFVVVSLTD